MAAEPTPAPRSRIARFGVYDLDVASGELRRAGVRVPLQDQPVRLLAFLLEHPGQVVTREELHEKLWPSEFVDFDHSLNTAVRKLRAALDDSADNPRFIETLARRGYRFIAPVSLAGEETLLAQAQPPRRAVTLPIVIAIVAIALFAGAILYFQRRTSAAPPRVDSIAVLPFLNADRDTQHINDGLTEILIDTISRLPELRVMAPTTVFRYKGASIDPKRAGKELGVAAVVTGSIRRENDRFSVRVELIDVSDGAQLWAGRYDASPSELPAIQSRIAGDLTTELRHGAGEKNRYNTTPEAYELYTKGLYAWNQRGAADLQRAIEYFNAAAERDPKFAAPYAGLANTYGVMVGYGLISVPDGATKVIANAQKALDLDPDNAEALVSIATTKFRNVWDFPAAEADYRRALKLNPNYATGHVWYSDYLRVMGRWDEARREIDTGYQLDPFSPPIVTMKCVSLYYERRYREAIEFSRRMGELDRKFAMPLCAMQSFLVTGDTASAAAVMRESGSRLIGESAPQIADAYARGGREAFLRKWIEVLQQERMVHVDQPTGIALLYAHLGDRDRAFAWLDKAFEQRVSRVTNINVEPAFDVLHDDPRWDNLLKRIGLPKVQPPGAAS